MAKDKYEEPTNAEREEIKSRLYLEFDKIHKNDNKKLDDIEYERIRDIYIEQNFHRELYKK